VTPKNPSAHPHVELSPPGGERPGAVGTEATFVTGAVVLHEHDRSVKKDIIREKIR